jgi:hypothetical protein
MPKQRAHSVPLQISYQIASFHSDLHYFLRSNALPQCPERPLPPRTRCDDQAVCLFWEVHPVIQKHHACPYMSHFQLA